MCTLSTEKIVFIPWTSWFQEDRGIQTYSRSLRPESPLFLQEIPHGNYEIVTGLVQPGDWFTTIDLKDAYFHVEIAPEHRKYLRFAFQGIAYEYNRLPFGYSLSPRTFSKCVATAL